MFAVGRATAEVLERVDCIAHIETAEGIVAELEKRDLSSANICLPRSALSRTVIPDYLHMRGVSFTAPILYDTAQRRPDPLPLLDEFDEIIFTSPSGVQAFVDIFGALPKDKQLTAMGPITEKALEKFLKFT